MMKINLKDKIKDINDFMDSKRNCYFIAVIMIMIALIIG